jgi:peptide/nickel transport system substrate-binding protein
MKRASVSRLVRFSARSLALAGATLLALGAASANAAGAADPTPKRGGILEFSVENEIGNYDCHANTSFAAIHPLAPHYSTLLKFDSLNYPQVKGDLAESWSASADKLTYSFKLRPNVLFHDGTHMTSADVKASYERIAHPPEGVSSVRQVAFSAVAAIDTPDATTVVFKLKWPEAAMLANFASPWNCIYSAAKLKEDANFPKTHVLGTGAFVFVEHVKGNHWTGKRFDKYFLEGRPYLDGFKADFLSGKAVVDAMTQGKIMGQFRSFTPAERDQLSETMGDKVTISEAPWINNILVTFNAKHAPFNDARVRRALSLAIDRWKAAEALQNISYLRFVGGLMRPGFSMATPESELTSLPGFSHDIEAARAEAKRLLADAGVHDLKFKLTNRDIPAPYGPGGDYLIEAWRAVGVSATQEKLPTKDWQVAAEKGNYDVLIDFIGDYFDDPTLQLAKFVSTDLSPVNYANSQDRFLDALYIGQAVTVDPRQRV